MRIVRPDHDLLAEQVEYYRARATEYDRVYAERADLRALLAGADELPIAGDVLELACGTGQWTAVLAPRARSVTALDTAPEALAIARARPACADVEFVRANVFEWQPPRRYDTVFFAFWLSHVPPARLPAFWNAVADTLAPGGKAIFVDDGPAEAVNDQLLADQPAPAALRRLDDGRGFRIVKVFHDAGVLASDLTASGWSADVRSAQHNFIVGVAEPPVPHTPAGLIEAIGSREGP